MNKPNFENVECVLEEKHIRALKTFCEGSPADFNYGLCGCCMIDWSSNTHLRIREVICRSPFSTPGTMDCRCSFLCHYTNPMDLVKRLYSGLSNVCHLSENGTEIVMTEAVSDSYVDYRAYLLRDALSYIIDGMAKRLFLTVKPTEVERMTFIVRNADLSQLFVIIAKIVF